MKNSSQYTSQYKDFIENMNEDLSNIADDIVTNIPVVHDFQKDVAKFQDLMNGTLGDIASRQSSPIVKGLINGYLQSIDDTDETILDSIDDQTKMVHGYNKLAKLASKVNKIYSFGPIVHA